LLVSSTASCQNIKTKALNVSKKELLKDLQRAPEFDQSAIYRKVFDDQGGSFGGEPFAFLVVDYDFSTSSEDIELLQKLSIVADASATSILTYCGPAVAIKEKRTSICAPSDRFRSRRRVIAPTTVSLGHWGRAPVPERGR
jgi:type VI secretion system protein ImpC